MAEKDLERGDTHRIYTSDMARLSVPYLPASIRPGIDDYGYVDLRNKPEAVDRIPEARGHPGFAAFLTAVNAADSELMSLACCVNLAPVRAGAVGADGDTPPTHFVDSMVDITFREPALAHGDNLLVLARRLMEVRQPHPGEWASYDLGILKLKSLFGLPGLAALNIRLRALGKSEDEAWSNFDFHWTQLAAAIRKMDFRTA